MRGLYLGRRVGKALTNSDGQGSDISRSKNVKLKYH